MEAGAERGRREAGEDVHVSWAGRSLKGPSDPNTHRREKDWS